MIGAAKRKSTFPPGLSALWSILLLVVALCLPETRVWGLGITALPASGVFESANPSSIGENTIAWQYDASCSSVAARVTPGKALLPGEGSVGIYDDLIAAGSKGDNLTPHHIPSANHMAGQGVPRGQGVSIMMEQPVPGVGGRHRATFTYGTAADAGMSSRDALAAGIRDARSIYMQDGLYSPYIRLQLQQVIQQNKLLYPSTFAK